MNTRNTHIPTTPDTHLVTVDPHRYHALGWLILGLVWGGLIGAAVMFVIGIGIGVVR